MDIYVDKIGLGRVDLCKWILKISLYQQMFFFSRSPEFSDFLRHALDKNLDNRWSATQLLQVSRPVPPLCNVI